MMRHLHGNSVGIAIDLGEVTLVDREIVRFLVLCEARGSKIENCPLYIREWMTQEQSG